MSAIRTLRVAPELDGVIRLGWFRMDDVDPTVASPAFERDLEALCSRLRGAYRNPASAGQRNAPVRTLYRAVGIDPTKHRPSSEALLRRVLTGKTLYRVNSVVDAANLWSLGAALPVGLYDADHLAGEIRARLGGAGEGYVGIGKGRINLEHRLMLCDEAGPFGNPSSDSWRARVRDETRRIFFVIFAPAAVGPGEMERLTGEAAELMVKHSGGVVVSRGLAMVRD
jgi:DNA/RNA-binding domain of Phe-tRNA-synthetase-like protein